MKPSPLKYFSFFHSYLGGAVFVTFLGSVLTALMDGIGLTMFIPLLSKISAPETEGIGAENLGRLDFIFVWLQDLGVRFNLTGALLMLLFFFAAKGVFSFISHNYKVRIHQRFANQIRLRNVDLLAEYDYFHFAGADAGEIQNSFSAEIVRIHQAFQQYFVVLQNAAMAMVYIGLAYLANPGFALLIALLGLISSFLFKRLFRLTKSASTRMTGEMNTLQGLLIQSVSNFKFLKATGLINQYKNRVKGSIKTLENHQRRIGKVNALSVSIREPIVIGLVVAAILIQVTYFSATFGPLILSLLFFYRGLLNIMGLQNGYNYFLGFSGSIDNMKRVVADLKDKKEANGTLIHKRLSEGVLVKDLSWSYNESPILEGLNFSIPKNTSFGIAGESGSGKTTLVNILAGLYRADPGTLFIDGRDITSLDLNTYRGTIGYVTQEPPVFSDTIFNNVSFWEKDTPANRERVWRALKLANADSFIEEMPQGLDETIGINGLRLSGGQRQRIAIAREIYREVDVLFFDEATSSLDSYSEIQVRDNLESLAGRYTTIIVAHRLSTLRNVDQILYLEGNGSYQLGNFASLQISSPGFARMVALQAVG